MIIIREVIKIKGYRGNFEKVIKFSKKGFLFSATYPELVVKTGITKTGTCYAQSYKDIDKKFKEKVTEFEMLHQNYKTVILYKSDTETSHQDGSGSGFILQWGVFREVESESRYHWERGYGKDMSTYWHDKFSKKAGWRKIEWTQQREQFFINVSENLDKLVKALSMFLTQENIEDAIKAHGRSLSSGIVTVLDK